MSSVPSIASSALTALQGGFASLDRGAAEMVAGTTTDPAQPAADIVDVRSGSIVDTEPMLAGIRDLMLARLQVGAGAAMLHAYQADRTSLYNMLKE